MSITDYVEKESKKLDNYSKIINDSAFKILKVNYTPAININDENDDNYYIGNQNLLKKYKEMNSSLENIKTEALKLEEYLCSKVEIKFGMEISLLIVITVFSLLGILGKN